jgi:prepilin-type N-terminal cleavage/methylation domain-containing protein
MKLSKGFTLIELIVVMAVFLFVIGVAVTIFISIISHQKRILAEQQLLNQISYVEEYMSKALRMANAAAIGDDSCIPAGSIYLLEQQSVDGFEGIKFINQTDVDPAVPNSGCQEFYLGNCDAEHPDAKFLCEKRGNNVNTIIPLTSESLQINYIKFSLNGSDKTVAALTTDGVQPRVTILMNVKIPNDSQEPERTIQTTISQRNINQ